MRLYVGNFNYRTTEQDLRELFSEFGKVTHVKIIMDKDTNQSKGYGFVEMATEKAAQGCIQNLNNMLFDGRTLKVDWANRKMDRRGGPEMMDGGAPEGEFPQ